MISSVVVLLAANLAVRIYSTWGLITLEVNKGPLAEVIKEIANQGNIELLANLDPDTLVTLSLDKVPIGEALENLAAVTDSRWRLAYFIAPTKEQLSKGVKDWKADVAQEDWKWFGSRGPMGGGTGVDDAIPDPRGDLWIPADDAPLNDFQTWLTEASLACEASFAVPVDWNPDLTKIPARGEVQNVIPKAAKKVGGKTEEVFLLSSSGRRGRDSENSDGERPRRGPSGFSKSGRERPNPEMMARAMEARIAKLPEKEQGPARERMNQMRSLFAGFENLTKEQRREKMRELFDDPAIQIKMEERRAKSDSRKTPEQRIERYKSYVQKKKSAKN